MTSKKSTKRALLMSVIAMLMCISMLLGTTYAWFTDQVSSSGNLIQTGTLDIALEKWDVDGEKWVDASSDPIFNYTKWEPGYTEVVNLRVVNLGTLALKWQAVIMTEESLSILADAIFVYVRSDDRSDTVRDYIDGVTDRAQFDTLAEQGQFKKFTLRDFIENLTAMTKGTLEAGQESYLGIVLRMDPTAGNEYQNLDLGGKFDLKIVATQHTYEEDSFDDLYDAETGFGTINSLDEFRKAAKIGGEYYLTADIVFTAADTAIMIEKDLIVHLNGYDIDASALKGRPFELADEVDYTINGTVNSDTTTNVENQEVVLVGAYGLVNIPAGNDATVTLNGGKYIGSTDNGSFIKPRGDGAIAITMNNVVTIDGSTNGSWIVDAYHYTGDQFSLEIDGGYYESNRGFRVGYAVIENAEIVVTGTSNQHVAIGAQYSTHSETVGVWVENCTIKATYGVAVGNGSCAYVKNSSIEAEGGYALLILGTGGTIEAETITYTGNIGTTGKVSATATIIIDGEQVYQKLPQ
ncbi:MAG: hypothetical protein E7590_05710 [Ruminococcaceae bacterium]|nr:hypothetical protein [Oscillospiraceae bacterium]